MIICHCSLRKGSAISDSRPERLYYFFPRLTLDSSVQRQMIILQYRDWDVNYYTFVIYFILVNFGLQSSRTYQ